jgi:hypothetical protein
MVPSSSLLHDYRKGGLAHKDWHKRFKDYRVRATENIGMGSSESSEIKTR